MFYSLPDHILIEIIKKVKPTVFVRIIRSCRFIYKVAKENRRNVKIYLDNIEYDITPPSRRRQMVLLYDLRNEEKRKILFPKNFETFIERTIPDLAFFHFDSITFSNGRDHWDNEMTGRMLDAMQTAGLSCKRLNNEVLIMVERSVECLRPKNLCLSKPFSLVSELKKSLLNTLNSVECVPQDMADLLKHISVLPEHCKHSTIWAHGLNQSTANEIFVWILSDYIKNALKKDVFGRLDIHFSYVSMAPLLKVFKELNCEVFKDSSNNNVFLLNTLERKKLVLIVFEDLDSSMVPYTMFHSRIVATRTEFFDFYVSIFRNEISEELQSFLSIMD